MRARRVVVAAQRQYKTASAHRTGPRQGLAVPKSAHAALPRPPVDTLIGLHEPDHQLGVEVHGEQRGGPGWKLVSEQKLARSTGLVSESPHLAEMNPARERVGMRSPAQSI